MALETETFTGVELLSVGTWPASGCPPKGCTWTQSDLDKLVEASTKVGGGNFRPPVKIGHNDNDSDAAVGTVQNLRRVGSKLLGDLVNVPSKVADLIRAGAFPNRSVEIREIEGQKNVLSGLALLGARLPAVTNLKDIQELYQDANLSLEKDTMVVYIAAQTEGIVRMEIEALQKLLMLAEDATEENIVAEIARLMKAAAPNETTGTGPESFTWTNNSAVKMSLQDKKKFSALEAKVLELETAREEAQAVSLVEDAIEKGKLLPAQKKQALTFALRDATGFAEFVDSQPSVIMLGEDGSSASSNDDATSINLSASEKELARQVGISEDELLAQKLKDSGATVPKALKEKVEKIYAAAMEG